MATKSIYKNVVIKNSSLSRTLVSALENAQNKTSKDVRLSKSCRGLKRGQIKDILGESN
jgi:hypothetical protein